MSKGKKDRRAKRKERTAKISGNALFSKALRDIDNKMKPPMPFEIVIKAPKNINRAILIFSLRKSTKDKKK